MFHPVSECICGAECLASVSGAEVAGCKDLVLKALKREEAFTSLQCTFGGVWSGGGGAGQAKLLVASFFFDKAAEVGFFWTINFRWGGGA